MQNLFRILFLVLLTSLVSACSWIGLGGDDEPEKAAAKTVQTPHYYIVDVDRGAVAKHFPQNRVLLIKPVRVVPNFRSKDLIFRIGEDEYQPQPNQQLFSDPSDMFTSDLRRWLEKSGLFSKVITDPDDGPADMVLESAVTALYGDKRQKYPPQAVIEMQFFLSSAKKGQQKVLYQTGLRVNVDIEQTTPAKVVSGWRDGTKKLLTTLEDDLSGYFAKVGDQ